MSVSWRETLLPPFTISNVMADSDSAVMIRSSPACALTMPQEIAGLSPGPAPPLNGDAVPVRGAVELTPDCPKVTLVVAEADVVSGY